MKDGIRHPIDGVQALPGYRLSVRWRAGGQEIVDFSGDVAEGLVWEPLRDEAAFAKVYVRDRGTVVEWPEPADDLGPMVAVDADGLWHMAREQEARNVARAAE